MEIVLRDLRESERVNCAGSDLGGLFLHLLVTMKTTSVTMDRHSFILLVSRFSSIFKSIFCDSEMSPQAGWLDFFDATDGVVRI